MPLTKGSSEPRTHLIASRHGKLPEAVNADAFFDQPKAAITLATTTSPQDSRLLDEIVFAFE
jgi:hypothetical protein